MSVNLAKGQTISLAKSDATPLTRVRMGLGWQAAQRKGFLGKLIGPKEVVYFNYLDSAYGAVRHSGDNRTGGDGPGDDEAITVDFTRVPPEVDQIVFTVNSFTGVTFGEVEKAYCRLVDEATGREIARYTLSGGGSHTALIMAKVSRLDDGWMLIAIGEPASGETFQALLPAIDSYL